MPSTLKRLDFGRGPNRNVLADVKNDDDEDVSFPSANVRWTGRFGGGSDSRGHVLRSVLEPVLGTRLDLQVRLVVSGLGHSVRYRVSRRRLDAIGDELTQLVAAETDRLSAIFSVYDADSELRRWSKVAVAGSRHRLSQELTDLLVQSLAWQNRSGGVYNPAIGAVYDRWRDAERASVVPPKADTDRWAASFQPAAYRVNGAEVECVGDCSGLTFNSFAKGLIADRAADLLLNWAGPHGERVGGCAVNLGGDIAVRRFPMQVGVEDPRRSYDNEPPLALLSIHEGGLATSGAARRPIVIGEHTFSHLIDPRTCRPVVGGPASVTVLGSTAAEADVLATIVAVSGSIPSGVAALLVQSDGKTVESDSFRTFRARS